MLVADERPDASLGTKLDCLGEITALLKRCRVDSISNGSTYGLEYKGVEQDYVPKQALKGRSISNHVKYVDSKQRSFPDPANKM
jgi:hypothetical protein